MNNSVRDLSGYGSVIALGRVDYDVPEWKLPDSEYVVKRCRISPDGVPYTDPLNCELVYAFCHYLGIDCIPVRSVIINYYDVELDTEVECLASLYRPSEISREHLIELESISSEYHKLKFLLDSFGNPSHVQDQLLIWWLFGFESNYFEFCFARGGLIAPLIPQGNCLEYTLSSDRLDSFDFNEIVLGPSLILYKTWNELCGLMPRFEESLLLLAVSESVARLQKRYGKKRADFIKSYLNSRIKLLGS